MKSWMLGFIQRCALGFGLEGERVTHCCFIDLAAAMPRELANLAVLTQV